MIRYTVTGLYKKDGSNIINSTLDYHRKKDVLDCIKENLTRDEFDTILIRKYDDG